MFSFIRQHVKAFGAGFFAGGIPIAHFVLRIPDMPNSVWLGAILKVVWIAVGAGVSGLATALITDIYKHYLRPNKFKNNDQQGKDSKAA